MTAPVFFGAGAQANGIASVNVAWPANHQVGDVALLVIETDGVGTTLTPSGGWAHVTGSPVTDVASNAGSKLHVLWKRATTTAEPDVATGDSGDHQVARIFVFRGVTPTGNPWNAITTGTKTTASTTATLPSITTTIDESLIVGIASRPDDSTSVTAFGAPVNAGITWDSNADIESGTNNGNGGGFVMVAGEEATAGATGTTTLTCPSVTNAYVVLGLSRDPAQSVAGELGAFNETGQAADLLAQRRTTGDLSTFTLAGQDAALVDVRITNRTLTAEVGAFIATGQPAGTLRAGSLTAEAAAYLDQGQDANLRRTVIEPAVVGVFTLAGQDAVTRRGIPLAADVRAFTLAGQDAGGVRGRSLAGDTAAYTLTGQPANLPRVYSLSADGVALAAAGQAAGTVAARRVAADAAVFNDQGQDATFSRTYVAIGELAALLLGGQPATTARSRIFPADLGTFTLAGQAAQLINNDAVLGGVGQFIFDAHPVNFRRIYSLAAETGAFTEQGQPAVTARSIRLIGAFDALTVTGYDNIFLRNRTTVADVRAFTLAGGAAALNRNILMPGAATSYSLTGQDALLSFPRFLAAELAELDLSGNAAAFRRAFTALNWTANTAFNQHVIVRSSATTGTGLVFKAVNAGTSGATEPAWPTTFGNTVIDGTITWIGVSLAAGELQSASPSSIIEMFVLELNALQHGANETYRFHAGSNLNANGELVWAGNTYQRFPVEAEGFEYNGQGQLPRPKIRVSNIFGSITAILLGLPSGLERAKVTRIRTLARYLDVANFPAGTNPFGTPDPTAEFPREIYYIDRKTAENRDVIEFELASAFDLQGVRAPKRQCVANICQWKYRSAECGYTESIYWTSNDVPTLNAAEDACGKRLSSCELRFSRIQRTGSVTLGSNVLTVSTTSGVAPTQPISGFGVPAGATVSAITSATTLTMSAVATASTVATKTGTASVTSAVLTVTNAAGLAIGQPVTGLYMPTGTTIAAIAGTTLTLNQRPYSIVRSGTYQYQRLNLFSPAIQRILIDTTGLSVGMRVWGSNGIETTISAVGAGFIQLSNYGTLPAPFTVNFTPITVALTLYFIPATVSASSYTFTGSPNFFFRSADSALPFGSFPGIGTYFT